MGGHDLSVEELEKLRRVLDRFQNTSRNDGDLGRNNVIQHRINTGAAIPIRQQDADGEKRNGASRSAESARKREN